MKLKNIFKWLAAGACGAALTLMLTAAGNNDFRMGANIERLVNMFRDISILYVDPVDSDQLMEDAAMGMVRSLDPYTEYISPEEMKNFETIVTGKYGGIGSLIRQKSDGVYFAEPYKDSPADKAGIVIGDKIVEIDGKSAEGMTSSQVSNLLRGQPGTHIKLKVRKLYTDQVVPLNIQRERIVVPGVPYAGFVNDSIGYIRHDDFSEDCGNDMRSALMKLRSQGNLRGLILDYRGNGGGILQEAVKILSLFVPKGTEVVSMRGRSKESNAVYVTQNEPVDTQIPIAVLTDSGTASAAEIVSGAIQDLDRGVLVGTRTFGKGLVQTPRPLGYDASLKITTAKYYIPSGRCIQAIDYSHRNADGSVGMVPDSLISEFNTRSGRKVYDGGGVVPEIAIKPQYSSRFAFILYNRGYIDDWADRFCKNNRDREVVLGSFHLTDSDYADFTTFMDDKPIDFESESAAAIDLLKAKAKAERYWDVIREDVESVEAKLKDDKSENLTHYRTELSQLLEQAIVLRRHYAAGVIEHSIASDNSIVEAVKVLSDSRHYQKLLTPAVADSLATNELQPNNHANE